MCWEAELTDVTTIVSELEISSIDPWILRLPIPEPVKTPMGIVDSAVALFVEVTTRQGETGWGEVWCNFPRFAAFNRAVLVKRVMEPLLNARKFSGPSDVFDAISRATNVLRLQSGDNGAMAAAVAGIDIALWDIVGQREQKPIWQLLGAHSGTINTYASLGRSHGSEQMLEEALAKGYRGFKLRCWGNPADHVSAYYKAREVIGWETELMADCNSSWAPEKAPEFIHAFDDLKLSFVEECMPVDSGEAAWAKLRAEATMPLAGGENMISGNTLEAALASGVYGCLQPDICKWGGFSGLMPVAQKIADSNTRFCPHIFSGAPGLLASAHLLAAANTRDGALEYGIEYNPPRDDLVKHKVENGMIEIGDVPGLGASIDKDIIARYRVATPEW